MMQPFSSTLLVEVEYDQCKYVDYLHLSKLCMWGEERFTHAHSSHRARPDMAWCGKGHGRTTSA